MRRIASIFFIASFLLSGTLSSEEAFEISKEGSGFPVNYEVYGQFNGIGTEDYSYLIEDEAGLKEVVGELIYPNKGWVDEVSIKNFKRKHPGKVNPWDSSNKTQKEVLISWALAEDIDDGVRLYHIAENLRKAGFIKHAVKAFYASIVHFPRTVVWSPDGRFYWYAAPEAISRIRRLTSEHRELGVELKGAFVDIEKAGGLKPDKDKVVVFPGKLIKTDWQIKPIEEQKVIKTVGSGKVQLVQFENKHWQLRVNQKPFIVKGVTYASTKVGETPHLGTLRPWMVLDDNNNGKNDGMFDSWVDLNRNNKQDENELPIGDAQLLEDLGVNAIRHYHTQDSYGNYDPSEYDKELMRTLHKDYGVYMIMGDFLGAYTIGSGASWQLGTDYTNKDQKLKMKEMVRSMVLDHKDEPYVLMWLLGNENQHPHSKTNASRNPVAFAKFLDEIALMIKQIDPNHPVAVCNLTSEGLKILSEHAPNIDIYGANVYSGNFSMGSTTQLTKTIYDKPLLFTEWGCDAYHQNKGIDEKAQSNYILDNWKDISHNFAGGYGEGNVIGGILFHWMDEWWKSPKDGGVEGARRHNTRGDSAFPFPDGWVNEEWLGIVGQGNGRNSPYLRHLRKAYHDLKEIWGSTNNENETDSEKKYIYYEGFIEHIDANGKILLKATDQKTNEEFYVRLEVDTKSVYVADVVNHYLYFEHLRQGDFVSIDCTYNEKEDLVVVDTIILLSVRDPRYL